jgi:hypothetical protein
VTISKILKALLRKKEAPPKTKWRVISSTMREKKRRTPNSYNVSNRVMFKTQTRRRESSLIKLKTSIKAVMTRTLMISSS